ncbi:hypothetical protein BSQ39_08305 [Loigolactobacillus backii]|nr:hypothetical protein BSQ39_08305 [Loigolactobacillus backii]
MGNTTIYRVVIHKSASINNLPKLMKLNRVNSTELANKTGYTQSYISKLANQKTPLQFDSAQAFLKALPKQNQFMALQISNKLVGITTPVIDGDRIMKEPLAMAVKTMPELSQALEAIQNALDELTIPKEDLKLKDFDDPKELVYQSYDAVLYLMNLIAFISRGFDFSMQDMLIERHKLWSHEGITK